jgi:hypothetical protein
MADRSPEPPQDGLASELARLNQTIAELAAANVQLEQDREDVAGRLEVAQHRRDVLAHAIAERRRESRVGPAARGRRGGASRAGPPAGGRVATPPRQPARAAQPASQPRVQVAPLPPEASSSSVQTIMLGLGALLLGIAAIVFVGVAITELDPWSQLVILLAVAGLFLAAAQPVASRGLTATAETLAALGLLLFAVAGYPLWTTEVVALPASTYSGLVAAATALVGWGFHLLTRLAVPAWATVLALQPVVPLVAAPLAVGSTGWAVVFSLVAAHNAVLATAIHRRWLGYLTWALHAVAVAVAVTAAVAGLFLAGTVAAAVPAGLALVLAGVVAVVGAQGFRRRTAAALPVNPVDLAGGLLTLAVIVAGSRVAALALPGRALLPIALIMTATTLALLVLPPPARRGPMRAAALALAAFGVVLAALALRAGAATLVWPPWPDDLAGYPRQLANSVGPATWQLAATAAAATVGAGFSLPTAFRREVTVLGAALTALAAPASLALSPTVGAWVLVAVAAGLALTGLEVTTRRAAITHVATAGVVSLAAAGASLVGPAQTATVLAALTVIGAVVAGARRRSAEGELVASWAAGMATLAAPAAAATGAVAAGYDTPLVLAAGFAAVCGSLGYAALVQLRHRVIPMPVRAGATIGAVGIAATALLSDGATSIDTGIAVLLLAAALAVFASPHIDAVRRPDRLLDGADFAAAAVTASVVVTLARIAALLLPLQGSDAGLATAATLVLLVASGVRAMPVAWRRGPVLGVAVIGGLVGGLAGAAAVVTGVQVLAIDGPLWNADLSQWPPTTTVAELSWAAPYTLAVLAVTAALVLPHPLRHRASAALAVLATIGAPVPLGLAWWGPAALAATVATGYALASVLLGRRAAAAYGMAAGTLAVYAVCASLARPGATAAVLGVLVLVGTVVAGLARNRIPPDPRLRIGGVAVVGVLLALPGMLAALASHLGHGGEIGLLAALGGASLGLAVMAAAHQKVGPYLPYGTIGITAGATAAAFATIPSDHPTGVYAAAAVLLAVLAELVRSEDRRVRYHAWRVAGSQPLLEPPRTFVTPPMGSLMAAAVPAIIALLAIAPALAAALIDPYLVVADPWAGPPPELLNTERVPATSVIAALLLTLAAALAAVGFGGAVTRQAAPVVAPGLAVTVLIAPAALDAPWPMATLAALAVFTFAMLGVALTPPPPPHRETRPLRAARGIVLAIGLAAGGAGLAGSFADRQLTWGTFGGAVVVGMTAAVGGRTRPARMLGWLGATLAAQLFALVTAVLLAASRPQTGFALLAVSALALLAVARLRALRPPSAARELAVVEWLGGYTSMAFAVALAVDSPLDLAAILVGVGAILGLAALRPGRTHRQRRILWWLAAVSEVLAWWIIMVLFNVGLLEAFTLPFALFALVVGALEVRYRPELGSWATYGPGLIAALAPSLLAVITTTSPSPARQVWVILGGVAALLLGSRLRQRAPLIIGSVVTAVAALHLLSLAGPWLMLIPLGLLLIILGANREKHQRDLERLRGAYSRMR